jgi:hypothetical protein
MLMFEWILVLLHRACQQWTRNDTASSVPVFLHHPLPSVQPWESVWSGRSDHLSKDPAIKWFSVRFPKVHDCDQGYGCRPHN